MRHERTQGVSTVVVVLTSALLLATTVALTSQLALSARRNAASQQALLGAQYAAESGLARAALRLNAVQEAIRPQHLDFAPRRSMATYQEYAEAFCDVQALPAPTAVAPSAKNGHNRFVRTCTPTNTTTQRHALLANLVKASGYQAFYQSMGLSQADAAARAGALMAKSVAERQAWWGKALQLGQDQSSSGAVVYAVRPQVINYRLEAYSKTSATTPNYYRFSFKSRLSAEGRRPGDSLTRRVVSPATADDSNGIYWFEIGVPSMPVLGMDASCTPEGVTAFYNLVVSGLNLDPNIGNTNSRCSPAPADLNTDPLATTLTARIGNADQREVFNSQFRSAFFPGESFGGGVFSNEFLIFTRRVEPDLLAAIGAILGRSVNPNITFDGPVQSAGCVRTPLRDAAGNLVLVGGKPVRDPASCVATADGVARESAWFSGILTRSLSATLTAGQAVDDNTLLAAVNTWTGSQTKFLGDSPAFKAPKRELFQPPVPLYDVASAANIKNSAGQTVMVDPNIAERRNLSKGWKADGTAPLPDSTGLNVDDVIAEFAPCVLEPFSEKKPFSSEFKAYRDDGYGVNARVRLQAADTFDERDMDGRVLQAMSPLDGDKWKWNSANQRYEGVQGKYQYIEIESAATDKVIPVPIQFRVYVNPDDPNDPKNGTMERATWRGVLGGSQYACPPVLPALINPSFKWVPYKPGKKFNGVIYGDGNLQVGTRNPRVFDPSVPLLNPTPGEYGKFPPAVAFHQRLDVVSAKNLHLVSDLALQQRPADGKNLDSVNMLNLYTGHNALIGNDFMPWAALNDSLRALIAQKDPLMVNMKNFKLDANIVAPNGSFQLADEWWQRSVTGTTKALGELRLLGSVTTRYNGSLGRWQEIGNNFLGYLRHLDLDERVDGGSLLGQAPSIVNYSSRLGNPQRSDLLSVIWRQGGE